MSHTRSNRQVQKSAGLVVSSIDSAPSKTAVGTTKACWSDIMNRELIQFYLEEMLKGSSASNGLKSQQWTIITQKMAVEFPIASQLTSQQVQSNWTYLKQKWRIYHDLRNKSGFGWNDQLNNFDCEKSVFDAYCAAHPGATGFWKTPLPFYDDLTKCFAH